VGLFDDDLNVALAICYELHNGGVDGVDDRWEWAPSLVRFRVTLEDHFETALKARVPLCVPDDDIAAQLRAMVVRDLAPSLSAYMATAATPEQFREFIVHRSFYQLREADPHTWSIPRLRGAAKAAMVMVQADEYGNGIESKMHSSLFRATLDAFELDTHEGAYVDLLPG
jgi:hypothetical protein